MQVVLRTAGRKRSEPRVCQEAVAMLLCNATRSAVRRVAKLELSKDALPDAFFQSAGYPLMRRKRGFPRRDRANLQACLGHACSAFCSKLLSLASLLSQEAASHAAAPRSTHVNQLLATSEATPVSRNPALGNQVLCHISCLRRAEQNGAALTAGTILASPSSCWGGAVQQRTCS